MKDPNQPTSESRRKFLRDAGVSGGLAAAAAAAPGVVSAAGSDADSSGDKSTEGYRLTQHILDYYKSASA
ncbi:MAG: twin-arginine translocation signal domain-containing protein [Gammaproteobacteria bacterium]|nr:twin-arginine translocation signal domain-containing protein [Gammaproteobacteria bacterium]